MILAFERPAYQTTESSLLPKEQLTRGVGLMGFTSNLLATFSLMVAGGLLGLIGLPGQHLLPIICVGGVNSIEERKDEQNVKLFSA